MSKPARRHGQNDGDDQSGGRVMAALWNRAVAPVLPFRKQGALQDAMAAAENTHPASGVGYGPPRVPPMTEVAPPAVDPDFGAVPPPPPYADEHADETAIASNIRWLVTVIEAHDNALARRQSQFDAAVARLSLEHETQMNKWRAKREHFAEQHESAVTRFAEIARSLGLTPDDLLETTTGRPVDPEPQPTE